MDIKTMTAEELEARKAEIAAQAETENDSEVLNNLLEEVRSIKEEEEARRLQKEQEEAEKEEARKAEEAEARKAVAEGAGIVIENLEERMEETKMTLAEIRSSKEYVDAYANYIKSADDTECRALLSENATGGTVPVPAVVYDIVKTAWEKDEIARRVRKAYIKGNLKVGFEISGTDATVHTEGQQVSPETLVTGIVELVPKSIKKIVEISDEALDMAGEDFLRYLYEELTYRIAKKAVDQLLAAIIACSTTATTTQVNVGLIESNTASLTIVAEAIGNLSDEAANPIVVMNKATWAKFKAAQAAGGYAYDPFEGLPVAFNNTLKSVDAATTGETWLIVGDFEEGALFNFPNGDEIEFKFDNTTKADYDLVRIIGRKFVGLGPVAPGAFVQVQAE